MPKITLKIIHIRF